MNCKFFSGRIQIIKNDIFNKWIPYRLFGLLHSHQIFCHFFDQNEEWNKAKALGLFGKKMHKALEKRKSQGYVLMKNENGFSNGY